jgi:hypothetical protein
LLSFGDALVEAIDYFDGRDGLFNPQLRKIICKFNLRLAQDLARDLLSLLFKAKIPREMR